MRLKIVSFAAMIGSMKVSHSTLSQVAVAVFALSPPILGLETASGQDSPKSAVGIGRVEKTLEGEREIRTRVEAFFVTVESGKLADAFASLMTGSPAATDPQNAERFAAQTTDVIEEFGTITSHEIIEIKRVGSRLMRFTYLSYSDDYPLKWEIYTFLGKTGWRLLDFSVNKNLEALFDSSTFSRRVGTTRTAGGS